MGSELSFVVEPSEKKKYDEWVMSHYKSVHGGGRWPNTGAIGGGITFEFTPTSIGIVFAVRCGFCKESFNLTDYDNW